MQHHFQTFACLMSLPYLQLLPLVPKYSGNLFIKVTETQSRCKVPTIYFFAFIGSLLYSEPGSGITARGCLRSLLLMACMGLLS